jgi:hypothetical protein
MYKDQLQEYLSFEAEFTQCELANFEEKGTERARSKVRHKRLEAKLIWEESGRVVPEEIGFV